MKKQFIIIALTVLSSVFPSCQKDIEIRHVGNECELSLNAALRAGSPDQEVYVAASYHDKVRGVKSAHMDCYVNGVLSASSDSLVSVYNSIRGEVMKIPFNVGFSPGDNVRIEVTADGMSAFAESSAPEPGHIVSADTTEIVKIANGRRKVLERLRIRLQDVPDVKNFYRIETFVKFRVTRTFLGKDDDRPVGDETVRTGIIRVKADNMMDPVLYSGSQSGFNWNYDPDDRDFYENEYNLFTDASFRDKEYVMTLLTGNFHDMYDFRNVSYTPDSRISEKRTLVIRLSTMDSDMYSYYNACMFDDSWQSYEDYLPAIPYPDNVSGGNGLVGAVSVYDYEMELPFIEDLYKYRYGNL